MKTEYIRLINLLHGYSLRVKEIHWNTSVNAEHLLCDEILDCISDCEDRFAECVMGMCGTRFQIGDLRPLLPKSLDLISMLGELEQEILSFEKNLTEKNAVGIFNILDELIEKLNKFKYRATQK